MVIRICAIFFLLHITLSSFAIIDNNKDGHHQLVSLYKTWRAFEQPPLKNGAPDYTQATFTSRMPAFKKLKDQLLSIDTTAWPIEQQADWHILMAEMNG
jgi:hypothetical protein